MERLDALGPQPRGIVLEALLEAEHRIVHRTERPRALVVRATAPATSWVGVAAETVETDRLDVGRESGGAAWRPSRNTPSKSSPSSSKYPAL